ncbi:hypothetical protein HOLleu_39824 [Holothuria leucospilota]|uniref:EF-hand domain-containing protein n=1 Tax=Holothuria leucospilota TaxID=206669 RepID=A0A9Q0YCK3_HOLLE|nr:hypothetical protein HOLleu_39824 [Holothuria leucospilota]
MKRFGETMDPFYITTAVFIVLCHGVTSCPRSGGAPGSDGIYGKKTPEDNLGLARSCGPTGGPTDEPPGSDGTYGKVPPDNDIFRADDLGPSRTGVIARRNIICFIGYTLIVICDVVTGCGPGTGGPPGSDGTYVKPPGSDGTYEVNPDDIPDISRTDARARRAVQDYQERPTPKVMFRVFDEDKNGNIDACEWMEAGMTTNVRDFVKILDEVDKDKDNVISIHEFEALHVGWKYGKIDAGTSSDEED